ncbi:MAG: ABC transporter permease [Verrucomicrobia bacterium]|nr:ABC transporter permease [Verrucomicrobiota bacterium]
MNDLKFAFRQLLKYPGFTAVAVLTLAVGIGANTAIFSFVDRVLLRCLPVSKSHELVQVGYEMRSRDGRVLTGATFNHPLYLSYRDDANAFSGLIAFLPQMLKLGIGGEDAGRVQGMTVSDNYFSVLGVNPVLGRGFLPEEAAGAHRVVVISHSLWQHRFGGEPTVVGRSVNVDGRAYTIVGVLRPEFTGTIVGLLPDVYLPLKTWSAAIGRDVADRSFSSWYLLGRIKPGLPREQAQAALRLLTERIRAVEPNNTHPDVLLWDGSRGLRHWTSRTAQWPVLLFFLTTVLVLLVACANVANMLLVRATTRRKEIAVRLALGAGRGDVIRQLICESTLLALLSGACGVCLAYWLSQMLQRVFPVIAEAAHVAADLDGRILVFALLVTLATAVLSGLAPALQLSRPQVVVELKESAEEKSSRGWSLRHFLVVAQVAIAVVILALGGLCLRSLAVFRGIDPGFDPARILAVKADFQGRDYATANGRAFFAELNERIGALPGVKAVSLTDCIPLSDTASMTGVKRIDQHDLAPDEKPSWNYGLVSPGYFQTLGVPLLRGRDFSAQDGPGAPGVMIVNDLLAQQYWPNQDPMGKRVTFWAGDTREVIGVVKAVKLRSIRDELKPLMYWPLAQKEADPVLLVRTDHDPQRLIPALHHELTTAGLRPTSLDLRTIAERQAAMLLPQRIVARILNAFGLVGLWLVALGLYGVMAYAVSQRTREIGIRMALGARVVDVLGLVVRQGAVLTALGAGLGLGLSLIAARWLEAALPTLRQWDRNFLYGVEVWDLWTYFGTASLLLLITLVACWIPARRAAKVDPVVALRYE